jgi:hypothetical protein
MRSMLAAMVAGLGLFAAMDSAAVAQSTTVIIHRDHGHSSRSLGSRCSTRAGVIRMGHRQSLNSRCRVHVRGWGWVTGRTVR